MHCTLLIPDLLWPREAGDEPYRDLELPALTRLLARAELTSYPAVSMEAWLCTAFEVERQQDWPVAPLTLGVDGGDPDDSYWLRCDPVCLEPHRAQVQLVQDGSCTPARAEADALAATLNSHFAADGLVVRPLRPHRWYLALERAPSLVTHSLPEVLGQDINRYLPHGDERLRWHRILNEVQMLWHEHPVNAAREQRGERPINSVWVWGGGTRPAVRGRPFGAVWSDDALAVALAVASDSAARALPDSAAALFAEDAHAGDRQLAALPQLRGAAAGGDVERWRATLQSLEHAWFAPLERALRERRLAALAIVALSADECRRYEISRLDAWKFWRARRRWHEHA